MRQVLLLGLLIAGVGTSASARGRALPAVEELAPLPLPAGADHLRAVVLWQGALETLVLDFGRRQPERDELVLLAVPARPQPGDLFLVDRAWVSDAWRAGVAYRVRGFDLAGPWHTKRASTFVLPLPLEWQVAREKSTAGAGPLLQEVLEPVPQRAPEAGRLRLLEARNSATLAAWLAAQGQPADAALLRRADGQFARGAWIVAVRLPARGRGPDELEAVGLRFVTPLPVVPLALAQSVWPAQRVVDVLLQTPWRVACKELTFHPQTDLRARGAWLDERRRWVCERDGGRALVELVDPGFNGNHLQRCWGLLPRDALCDLTFDAAIAQSGHRLVEAAVTRPPFTLRQRLARAAWLPALALWLLTWLLLARTDEPLPPWPRALLTTIALGVAWVEVQVLGLLLLVPASLLMNELLSSTGLSGQEESRVAAELVALGLAGPAWLLTLLSWWPLRGWPRQTARALAPAAAAAVVFALLCDFPEPGPGAAHGAPAEEAVKLVQVALTRVAADTGALPARPADLTAQRPPAHGTDASGNPVAIAAQAWHGPYLRRLPIDPTTLRRDTWWYDPTSDRLVEGGGWQRVTAVP